MIDWLYRAAPQGVKVKVMVSVKVRDEVSLSEQVSVV